MRIYLLSFFLLFVTRAYSDEIKVEINPPQPVAGEVFQVYFRLFSSEAELPEVFFSAGNLEVVGKSNQGVSTRTIYANGKLTVSRELTIVYDLVASRPGSASLRDINARLGNKTLKHPNVNFEVLKEPIQSADVFIKADVPKTSLYLGEGMVVRYYLYTKVPVTNMDVKKYPKLNHFLKRFIQDPDRSERVSVNGEVYMRTQIYAAKLFPEKLGELKIDSLQMSASYSSSRANDPFGAFGIGQSMRTKSMLSDVIKIEVKPLPSPVPSHFTGLIGTHDFQFEINQTKLIVNEPLEIKLTISGVGALENLESPSLISHPGLEEFETNGDLKISDSNRATKIFEYTFLAKENLTIPSKKITLSYFDPDSQNFVSKDLIIPEIMVAGGLPQNDLIKKENSPVIKNDEILPRSFGINNLNFSDLNFKDVISWRNLIDTINTVLVLLLLFSSILWFVKSKGLVPRKGRNDIPISFKKGKFHLSDFLSWLKPVIEETGKSPGKIIQESSISVESKTYFIELLEANAQKEYSSRKMIMDFKYKESYFKELKHYIESFSDANHS